MSCLNGTIAGARSPEDIGDLQRGDLHEPSAVTLRFAAIRPEILSRGLVTARTVLVAILI
jgi:hypothetical protein